MDQQLPLRVAEAEPREDPLLEVALGVLAVAACLRLKCRCVGHEPSVSDQLDATGARNTARVAIPAAQLSIRSRFGSARIASVLTKR